MAPESSESSEKRGITQAMAVSPDDNILALGSEDGFVVLYDIRSRDRLQVFPGLAVHSVAFSPDGKRLLTNSSPSEPIKVWDLATGQELLTLSGRGAVLNHLHMVDGGDSILTGRLRGVWQIWRAPSWEEIEARERNGGWHKTTSL